MFGYLIMLLLFILTSSGTLLFGVLAQNKKNNAFFIIALVFAGLFAILFAINFEFYVYQIMAGDITQIGLCIAWVTGIIFAAMSKSGKPAPQEVTVSYLDEIINAPDEEWDPES